jgi:hypothetical protein
MVSAIFRCGEYGGRKKIRINPLPASKGVFPE